MQDVIDRLHRHGIQPTPQRIAVAQCVLHTEIHPTADAIWDEVKKNLPTVSRATVYNTLNLFAERGLIRPQVLVEGTVVFDAHTAPHHHLIDDETGDIYDIPWDAIEVSGQNHLEEYEVHGYQVVMRGRKIKE